MARMIPKNLDPETKSAAEKKLFKILRDMPETNDWTVFHSVGIAKHPTQSQGEADFTVIIPGGGIFVLEVKGGSISYSDGKWYSIDFYGDTHVIKNPQTEASNAAHAFSAYVDEQAESDSLRRLLFGYGVVFPDTEVAENLHIPDLAREQIADIRDLENFRAYLVKLAAFWQKRRAPIISIPNASQCAELVKLFRPDFQSRVSAETVIRNLENQIIDLTENQQEVFEGLEENPRCLVKGSAGTGKTILAMNYARSLAKQGRRVAFFCYNRKLAAYIRKGLEDCPAVFCGSFTEYAESVALEYFPERCAGEKEKNADAYYRSLLPELLSEVYLDGKLEPFSSLIVDEAQDLMQESYLDAFDCLLEDGLVGGNWCFFLDAEKQNLFCSALTEDKVKTMLKERKIFFTNYTLKDNCRNSIAIIEKLDAWFGSRTKSHLSDEYGCDVEIKSYKKPTAATECLESFLNRLIKDGVQPSDIVILSPVRLPSSCASQVQNYKISNQETCTKDEIPFSTVQAYKGLESPVVILTDIENVFSDNTKNILYVGMTRARSILYIIASEHVSKILNSGKELGHG